MEVEEEEKQRNESEPWGSLERISEKCVLLFEALESKSSICESVVFREERMGPFGFWEVLTVFGGVKLSQSFMLHITGFMAKIVNSFWALRIRSDWLGLPPNEDWEQTDIWLHIFSFIQQVHDVDPVRLTDGDTLTRRGKDPLLTCRLVCKAWRQFSDSTLPFVREYLKSWGLF